MSAALESLVVEPVPRLVGRPVLPVALGDAVQRVRLRDLGEGLRQPALRRFARHTAGAEILREPEDLPFGRLYSAADPEGHRWMFMQPTTSA